MAGELDFHAGGIRFTEILIDKQAIGRIHLQRDQVSDPVAENTAREREMWSESLFHDAFGASDGLRLEMWVAVVERSEIRCEFERLGGAEGRTVEQFQSG